MSYAQHSLGDVGVGTTARRDPILANASLLASQIILEATKKPAAVRAKYVANRLDAVKLGLSKEVATKRRALVTRGTNRDQATFDAMRLGIANVEMDRGIASLTSRAGAAYNGEAEALGDDAATGCAIASTASTVGGIASVIPVYGTIAGLVVGIGSGIASQALHCGAAGQAAAQAAAQAQANLQAAQQQAAMQQQMQQQAAQQRTTRTLMIGGGIVGALALAYFIL